MPGDWWNRLRSPERWPLGVVAFLLLVIWTLTFLCGLGIGMTA